MATIEELQAELATVTADRDEWKAKHTEVAGEAKGHRLNANKFKGQLEALQADLDTLTNERDGMATNHSGELERLRVDLTAQLNAKQGELDQRVNAERDLRTNTGLETAAARLGMRDMDGLKLIDRAGLRIADNGDIENADEILNAFKESKPYFFAAGARQVHTTTSTTQPPRPAPANGFDARTIKREDYQSARRVFLAEQN